MTTKLRIGTRPSPLAIRQVKEVQDLLPSLDFEIVTICTQGDMDKTTPLSETEGSDFFTRQIEQALLEGRIDAAVHSAKDIEEKMPEGLMIAAMTSSVSPYDCLVSRNKQGLDSLPPGSKVGTSSRKRKEAILRYRNDLIVKDIRGDINERLAQLDKGDFDAIFMACAGLIRLGREDRITEVIPPAIVEPHPLQGRLAVQIKRERKDLLEIFRDIDAK